jgi:hypothetical protein
VCDFLYKLFIDNDYHHIITSMVGKSKVNFEMEFQGEKYFDGITFIA